MLLDKPLRWPRLLQDVLNRRLLFKQTGSSSTKGKPSPIISCLELGRRKLSMQPKFVAAQKMLLNRNPANIRKWIARFITLGYLYPLEARVYCSQ